MRAAQLAKDRAKKRAADAGAIVIVVAMAIAVLATMGVYALRSSQQEMQTSGGARQRMQAHYLDEYALIGTVQHLTPGRADAILKRYKAYADLTQPPGNNTDTGCASVAAVPLTAERTARWCQLLPSATIGLGWQSASGAARSPLFDWDGGKAPGSLGTGAGGVFMGGDFWVELSDPAVGAKLPGYTNHCYAYFTVTAAGATLPRNVSDAGIAAGLGIETARARIRVGPVTTCDLNQGASK